MARVTMMLFLIIGASAGVLLGLRFKVFVLVPFILILACAIVGEGVGLLEKGVGMHPA